MSDKALQKLLKEAHRSEPVPDFEQTWRKARAAAQKPVASALGWQRVLVPLGALLVTVIIAVAVLRGSAWQEGRSTSVRSVDPKRTHQVLTSLTDLQLWSLALDEVDTDEDSNWPGLTHSRDDTAIDESNDEQAFARFENRPGYDVYEAPTDFLLELEIPAWRAAEQRSM